LTNPRDWDAAAYERISDPQLAMGREVLYRLPLRGDETVLDAGCGTGRVTELLAERLPRGRVIAVDGSPSMVEQARARLPESAEVRVGDLLELEVDEPVDAVFSTATFHWIGDHERLFDRLASVLRAGGRLVAQCGGAGNIASVVAAVDEVSARSRFAPAFAGWEGPWHYAAPEETEARLRRSGFSEARAWLTDFPVTVDEPRQYFATVMLGSHVERLGPELRDEYVGAVLELLPHPVRVDYVRLNIDAVR
jgi:trans-aconitate 2-methyltransferase